MGGKLLFFTALIFKLILHILFYQELAYGSDIDIGRSGPSLLLDFDDLPAGGWRMR